MVAAVLLLQQDTPALQVAAVVIGLAGIACLVIPLMLRDRDGGP